MGELADEPEETFTEQYVSSWFFLLIFTAPHSQHLAGRDENIECSLRCSRLHLDWRNA